MLSACETRADKNSLPAGVRDPFVPAPTESFMILKRIKAGDHAGIDLLFRRYSPRLLGLIRAKLPRDLRWKTDSMDILQESFISALDDIPAFEPRSQNSLFHWFAAIIENKIRDIQDRFRAAKRDARAEIPLDTPSDSTEDGPPADDLPGEDKTPSQLFTAKYDQDRIRAAIKALGPGPERVLVMRIFEGCSFEEIGRLTGKNADAVRMTFSRNMAKLLLSLDSPVFG